MQAWPAAGVPPRRYRVGEISNPGNGMTEIDQLVDDALTLSALNNAYLVIATGSRENLNDPEVHWLIKQLGLKPPSVLFVDVSE